MDSDTDAESDMSLLSRSFLEKVNDRVRKIQDKSSKDATDSNEHYVFDIGSICIHGKELLKNFTFYQKDRKRSHNETDVRHILKVDSRTVR